MISSAPRCVRTEDGAEGSDREGDGWPSADADGVPDTLDGGGGFDRVLTLSANGNDVLLNVERALPARLSRLAVDVLFPDLFPPAASKAKKRFLTPFSSS